MTKEYPRISELGIVVHEKPVPHVREDELTKALGDRLAEFSRLFGTRTKYIGGPYPHDVEAVLTSLEGHQ